MNDLELKLKNSETQGWERKERSRVDGQSDLERADKEHTLHVREHEGQPGNHKRERV